VTVGQTHLLFHDELEEIQFGLPTRIYTLDLSNLRAPIAMTSYQGTTGATDHNGYTKGVYYFVSHYRRGLVVLDASDPTRLVEVAHFDNYLQPAANTAGTDGAWGVYPFFADTILLSDIENGLFLLRDNTRLLRSSTGRVGFGELEHGVTENGGPASIPVRRVGGLLGPVTVRYATTGGTAADGADYLTTTGTLSWNAGDMSDRTIAIPLIDDTTVESAETLTVTLSSLTGASGFDGTDTLTVTVSDNDTPAASGGGGGGGGGGGATSLVALAWLGALLAVRRRFARYNTAPLS
jgi:hypothetical protein